MYQVKNNQRLVRRLAACVCGRDAIIAGNVYRHSGRPHGLWVIAETAVKCADHNPRLVD
jgi:hypothetical protein